MMTKYYRDLQYIWISNQITQIYSGQGTYRPLHEQVLNITPICFPAQRLLVLLIEKHTWKFSQLKIILPSICVS